MVKGGLKNEQESGHARKQGAGLQGYSQFGGRDVPGILERLSEEHGIRISTQTLYTWKREGQWGKRLAGEPPTYEQFKLLRLMGIIEKFEQRLTEGPADPQTAYAYTGMLSTFFRLSKRVRPLKPDPEVFRRKAQEILENDYGIMRDGTRRFDV